MTKVLYLRSVYWFGLTSGGSVGHTSGVINAMSKHVELKVVTNDTLQGVEVPTTILKPFRSPVLPLVLNEFINNFNHRKKLKRLVKRNNVIYQRYTGFSFVGCMLAKNHRKKFILEFNSSDIWKIKNWSGKNNSLLGFLKSSFKRIVLLPIVQRVEKYNLENATLIVVVSDVLKKQLIHFGVSPTRVLVNPNGVNTDIYFPEISGKNIREKYSIGAEQIVIGFIGTFGQWHGVLEMGRAIELFYKKFASNNVRFLLIGEGNLLKDTQNIIKSADLDEEVVFTGMIPQENGPEYLAACDILLSPHIPNPDGSDFFGSPTKLFEYMAMGKAIIASELNQIGEILEHHKTALLVEPGNINQLAEAMNSLVLNEEKRISLGKNARKEVVSNYTWTAHVDRILDKVKLDG